MPRVKIRFLVPTLEAGRDGVADYTLRLAAECERMGHAAEAIGFHDAFAREKALAEGAVRTLRLPQALSWGERREAIQKFGAKPDVVSLQFVPYAFHPKGLATGWAARLREAFGGAKLQVMFHELWLGTAVMSPWKHRIIGVAQRHFILNLLEHLKPAVVQTSNGPYAEILARSGVKAEVLPLFGNIPIQPRDEAFAPATSIPNRAASWLIGFFGAIHPEWSPEPLFSELERSGKPIVFVQIGRAGAGEASWREMEKKYENKFNFLKVGEQRPEIISQWLQHLDFGIATSPLALIEKSGTVAAMREHGLPVIVTRLEKLFKFQKMGPDASGLILFSGEGLAEQLRDARRGPLSPGVAKVARRFLESVAR